MTRTEISPRRGERGEFATLLPERGDAWVKVQRVIEGGGVHLDLDVDQPLAEVAAEAARLGATEVARHDDVIVMTSPGGFTFCLTSWSNAGSPTTQIRDDELDLLDQVCLDVPSDLYAGELDFWEQLTGWPRRAGALPEFTSLTRPDGIPVRLLFQKLGEPTGPVHGALRLRLPRPRRQSRDPRDGRRERRLGARVLDGHARSRWAHLLPHSPPALTDCVPGRPLRG